MATLAGELAKWKSIRRRRGAAVDLEPAKIRVEMAGSAGQGFAAFATHGLDITLDGEANDSMAKSMSGGRLIVRPSPLARFDPRDNAIVGNCALYGATGGSSSCTDSQGIDSACGTAVRPRSSRASGCTRAST
ncbi:MAG: hypothetical protein HC923_02620 [Myxococcales bacterium]|nr:hypothetical protein [Myxococcales bacterium]